MIVLPWIAIFVGRYGCNSAVKSMARMDMIDHKTDLIDFVIVYASTFLGITSNLRIVLENFLVINYYNQLFCRLIQCKKY